MAGPFLERGIICYIIPIVAAIKYCALYASIASKFVTYKPFISRSIFNPHFLHLNILLLFKFSCCHPHFPQVFEVYDSLGELSDQAAPATNI